MKTHWLRSAPEVAGVVHHSDPTGSSPCRAGNPRLLDRWTWLRPCSLLHHRWLQFSDNFAIMLFHYDGRVSEWNKFEWSKRAIHISVSKQTKWWYAKRFLHRHIVAAYEYIFIWDADLGVDHINAEEFIKLVKKYGLDICEPGLEPED